MFLTEARSVNHITNRDTFGPLVGKYNGHLSKDEQSLHSVDTSVVDIRNALAHGLVSGSRAGFPSGTLRCGRTIVTRAPLRKLGRAGSSCYSTSSAFCAASC